MSEPTPPAVPASKPAVRLQSLDAYRGLVMGALAFVAFGLHAASKNFPDSPVWQALGHQTEHVRWVGCVAWDMIQPSFMFLVGVAMAFSYGKRHARGDSYGSMLCHAVIRSIVLVALGIMLSSNWSKQTNFEFPNVLAQIGLGYTFVFLLWNRRPAVQFAAVVAILVLYWGLFALYPLPPQGFDYASVGVPEDWNHLTGFAAHWGKNTNPAADFDVWFLNLFPRPEPFVFNKGGYQTLNFIPSIATMLLGLMIGELLRSNRGAGAKFGLMLGVGLVGVLGGWALDQYGICPVVKRIWTPSWAIYSSGWACLVLALFYGVVDLWRDSGLSRVGRWITFPLIVFGMNSILVYMMFQLARSWTRDTLKIHLGANVVDMMNRLVEFCSLGRLQLLGANYTEIFGPNYVPIVEATCVGIAFWLFCFWLYRQKIFLRV